MPRAEPGEGFAQSARIRKRREFLAIQRRGRRRHTANFIVISARNATIEAPLPRLGVTVSRHVGNAVVRNRVKRALREFFRRARASRIPVGLDLVIVAKPGAGQLGAGELGAELAAALGV